MQQAMPALSPLDAVWTPTFLNNPSMQSQGR